MERGIEGSLGIVAVANNLSRKLRYFLADENTKRDATTFHVIAYVRRSASQLRVVIDAEGTQEESDRARLGKAGATNIRLIH